MGKLQSWLGSVEAGYPVEQILAKDPESAELLWPVSERGWIAREDRWVERARYWVAVRTLDLIKELIREVHDLKEERLLDNYEKEIDEQQLRSWDELSESEQIEWQEFAGETPQVMGSKMNHPPIAKQGEHESDGGD